MTLCKMGTRKKNVPVLQLQNPYPVTVFLPESGGVWSLLLPLYRLWYL